LFWLFACLIVAAQPIISTRLRILKSAMNSRYGVMSVGKQCGCWKPVGGVPIGAYAMLSVPAGPAPPGISATVTAVQNQLNVVINLPDANGGIFAPNRMWSAIVDREGKGGRLC
jgi:hypothetical protein